MPMANLKHKLKYCMEIIHRNFSFDNSMMEEHLSVLFIWTIFKFLKQKLYRHTAAKLEDAE